jgi:hypothetical protein
MDKNDPPFKGMSDIVKQNFSETRKAMENWIDVFQKSMKVSPWFGSSDLNKKMQSYMEQNVAAASDFAKKLSQAKDIADFWRLQTEFVETQWKAFSEQTKDIGETMTKGATGALKDFSS